ncbi:PfkB family carbohydrate kinase [Chachezhania sediminis]|uniref:PfkB family carbohydrate kinase n=1 Tax=Chachezhania sediminis TaxID=2599291 RepID=UPI00131B1626|nr:PfkB family carbohydrate kinase [Chachezhania sediminis]
MTPQVLCIGALHWDNIAMASEVPAPGADLPGRIVRRPGGVAFNVARALVGHGIPTSLLAALGGDTDGEALQTAAIEAGIGTQGLVRLPGKRTDAYLAIESPAGLLAAVADTSTLEIAGPALAAPLSNGRLSAPWPGMAVIDANLPRETLTAVIHSPGLADVPLCLVPASPAKAPRFLPHIARPRTTLYVNRAEAGALLGDPHVTAPDAARRLREAGVETVVVTDGAAPVTDAAPEGTLSMAPPVVSARQVTGAGDLFLAAHIASLIRGNDRKTALKAALDAAARHVSGAAPT